MIRPRFGFSRAFPPIYENRSRIRLTTRAIICFKTNFFLSAKFTLLPLSIHWYVVRLVYDVDEILHIVYRLRHTPDVIRNSVRRMHYCVIFFKINMARAGIRTIIKLTNCKIY